MTSYSKFLQQISKLSEHLHKHYARHLVCHAGCSGCCHHHLSVFPVEADSMKTAITDLPDKTREQITQQALQVADSQTSSCPLLVNDRCSIYEARPVICRTQGLPLLLETADGTPEVDFCPLNFTAENAVDDLTENNLVPLDKINLQLAILNLRYCRAHGIPDEQSGERIKTADVILRAMTQVRS